MSLLGSFDAGHRRKVVAWQKAVIVPGYDPSVYRKDRFDWWIAWNEYGKLSEYGWEIDHTLPVALGGSDASGNLQALHWRCNRAKSDNFV